MGGSVSGTNCHNEFQCWWTSNTGIDPAFTGIIIDIPSGSASPTASAQPNGDWPISPPTPLKFGFAPSPCQGYQLMLAAQASEGKEIGGIITTEGKVIMFPTLGNDVHKVKYHFPYLQPNGAINVNLVYGNPDPADPKNDGKYQDDDRGIEIADYRTGQVFYYKIAGLIHSHPIEYGYDYNNPSSEDLAEARTWPAKIKHYIINEQQLIEFNRAGSIINRNTRPCN